MTVYSNSFELLIRILAKLGIEIENREALIERLEEVHNWRYAFKTLVTNGKRIGISFRATADVEDSKLEHALAKFHFDSAFASKFIAHAHSV